MDNADIVELLRGRNTWARQMADLRDDLDTARQERDEARQAQAELDTERTVLSVKLDNAERDTLVRAADGIEATISLRGIASRALAPGKAYAVAWLRDLAAKSDLW